MNKAIRYVITIALGFGIGFSGMQLGLWHDAEGEIAWIPFIIFFLLVTYGGGWLDRKVLQRFLPD